MLRNDVLQRVAAVFVVVRAIIFVVLRANWRAAKWIATALAWSVRRVAGAIVPQREMSPAVMLGGYVALLCATAGYGLVSTVHPGDRAIETTSAAPIAHTGQIRSSAVIDRPLRLSMRELQESQHLQPIPAQAAPEHPVSARKEEHNAGKKAVSGGAKAGPEKMSMEKAAAEETGAEKKVCKQTDFAPGRAVSLDTQGGGEYGLIQFRKTLPLNDKEVVFTFDDGPHPVRTPQVLDILDRYCIKAVFFMIGEMAERSPELVREIKRRGHTIGAHTWSHPLSLAFLSEERAEDQIERGFAAVANAAGEPIAPFFRFPGLGQSKRLLEYLAHRDIAVWSVDVVSGDSEGASAGRMPALVMSRLDKHGRGVLLFHDIKKTTVDALPTIIERLRDEGYVTAQVVPATPLAPDPALIARLNARRQEADLRYGRGKIR